MFCSKCGTKNEAIMNFCGSCGGALGQQSAPPMNPTGAMPSAGSMKFEAVPEDTASIIVAGISIKAGVIFRIVSVLLLIMYFVPFFTIDVRLFGVRISESFNGWNTTFGIDGQGGTFVGIFPLLIPIALFLLFQFNSSFKFAAGKLFFASTILLALGILALIIIGIIIGDAFQGHANASAGLVISYIFYILAGAISVGFLLATKKKQVI